MVGVPVIALPSSRQYQVKEWRINGVLGDSVGDVRPCILIRGFDLDMGPESLSKFGFGPSPPGRTGTCTTLTNFFLHLKREAH